MACPKRSAVKDPAMLAEIRSQPCVVCGATPSDAAHIKSRGAGGDDTADNLMPLCREHHRIQHADGWPAFAFCYSSVQFELLDKGWGFESQNGRTVLKKL